MKIAVTFQALNTAYIEADSLAEAQEMADQFVHGEVIDRKVEAKFAEAVSAPNWEVDWVEED